MPTCARKHQLQGNLVYHVMNRSVPHHKLFYKDNDFQKFIRTLKNYKELFKFSLYNWVLMPNHYHLLLEIKYPQKLPALMAGINRSYTAYHHKKHNAYGYLWQGRYKAQPVQKDAYLLRCARYIEQNPVKAKLVNKVEKYPYSSTLFYLKTKDDQLTTQSNNYISIENSTRLRKEEYKRLLNTPSTEKDVYFDNMENPVGNKHFISKLILENGLFVPRRKGQPTRI